jgi:hypothetical protein
MKHLLNNLSEEEKNSIREQHTGGMKVMTENFNKLINSKLGDSKPIVSEQRSGLDISSDMLELMKRAYLKYKPLGRDGLKKNNKVEGDSVLKIQKYFNGTGRLGKNKKYDSLKENGIFDEDTFWQVNNTLGSADREWWTQNKY